MERSPKESGRLAVCIPTYMRSRVVWDFLERAAKMYLDAGIDLYYYDSSPDDETEEVVQSWMRRFPNRIFYIRVPEDVHPNMKVYKIFQLDGIQKQYDFIWVCNDAIRFTEAAISRIMSSLDSRYDLIEVNARDVEQLGTRVYEDRNVYFKDCAWELSLFGAAILNTGAMLEGVDWVFYEEKYRKSELINFSHVSFYFNRFAEMEHFRALHLSFSSWEFSSSIYKSQPGWYRDAAYIYCESWISTLEDLPECYKWKAEVIKKCGKYSMLRNVKDFRALRREGAFSLGILWKYRDKWERVCDVPFWQLCLTAAAPRCFIRSGWKEERLEKKCASRLFLFCRGVQKVYLFGTGWGGYSYAQYLERSDVHYQGFCVTNAEENPKSLCGHPVCAVDTLNRESDGIVVSLESRTGGTIQAMLKERGFLHVYYDPDFFNIAVEKIR